MMTTRGVNALSAAACNSPNEMVTTVSYSNGRRSIV